MLESDHIAGAADFYRRLAPEDHEGHIRNFQVKLDTGFTAVYSLTDEEADREDIRDYLLTTTERDQDIFLRAV